MSRRAYLKPSWWQRTVGNWMASRFGRSIVTELTVRGRSSGRPRTVPVVVLDHEGERYLVSPYGAADWALNLRAAGECRLRHRGREEHVTAVEVPVADREPLLAAYQRRYGRAPGVRASFRRLPDPADHPTFRVVTRSDSPPSSD